MSQPISQALKPFVKWAGGKGQFLEIINLLLPLQYNHLIEPFVGGGAVFLSQQASKVIINDANQELIITYQLIKKQPQELLQLLKEYQKNHSKEFYEVLRCQEIKNLTELGIAARFIYLNKTGFNGLYRVNSQNIFNVPWGQREKVNLVDKINLLAISDYLNKNNCQIFNHDYQELLPLIKKDDFLFVDPPYDSEKSNGFTSYTAAGFNRKNQKELFVFLKEVEKKGAKWLLTNHDTEFIQKLYKDYQQFTKKAQRFINCQGDKRVGSAREIFIWNYPLNEGKKQELKFESFFDTIQNTNIDLEKLVDWKKISANLVNYEEDLNKLNTLLCHNKEELEEKISQIWENNPDAFHLLPLLLAVKEEDFAWLDKKEVKIWKEDNLDLEKVRKFITESGLIDLLNNGQIKNLKDYVLGIEVGLDTHSRKNRGGKTMENIIEKLLVDYKIEYQKQVIKEKKQFDFLIKIKDKEYYCETNFFNSSGSKISEVIRAYSSLYQLTQKKEINFLWITDGKGLKSVKKLLKDVFFSSDNFLFTIVTFEKWLKKENKCLVIQ